MLHSRYHQTLTRWLRELIATETTFYRAMLGTAQLCHSTSACQAVCLSVCDVQVCFHTGWNTSKIIQRPNSFKYLLTLTPASAIWSNGNTPPPQKKIVRNRGWGHEYKKPAISLKWCQIWPMLLWRSNRNIRKLHICFRLVRKSMTLDNLERPIRTLLQQRCVFWSSLQRFECR